MYRRKIPRKFRENSGKFLTCTVIDGEGNATLINNPSQFPEETQNIKFEEPVVMATIVVPQEYLSNCLALCEVRNSKFQRDFIGISTEIVQRRRGEQQDVQFVDTRIVLKYK